MRSSGRVVKDNIRTVKRLLLLMTGIISAAVLGFTVYMIAASDDIAEFAAEGYASFSRTQAAIREAEIAVLRIGAQAEAFVRVPDENVFWMHESQISGLDALEAIPDSAPAAQLEQLRLLHASLRQAMEAADRAALSGSMDVLASICSTEVLPLLTKTEAVLQEMSGAAASGLADVSRQIQQINARINAISAVFAAAVVAVTLGVSMYANGAIRRINADAYRQEAMLGLISDNVDEVFEVYNVRDGQLEFVSPNLERLFGVPQQAYLADHEALRNRLDADDLPDLKAAYFDPDLRDPQHVEFRYRNPQTDRMQTFHSVFYPIAGMGKEAPRHILLTRDVTEESLIRSELEEALAAAEAANKAKQEFLSRMSHEVRTPINAIIGMEALANSALDDPARVAHYLRQIGVSARHLLSLVNDMLDMAKIEQQRLEFTMAPINLEALLSDLVMMVSSRTDAKRQTLTVKSRHLKRRYVIGDEMRLRQVLLNLLTNANKYTQEGGSITLRVSQEERPDGLTDTTFTVSDNGLGISPEDMERVFLPFERSGRTSSQPGTGLGLPISRHIVEGMGGKLEAASTVNEGSEFSFTVPMPVDREAEGTAQAPGGCLLVVDDNAINMEIARELLLSSGYEVREAANGLEAVEQFAAEPAGTFAAVLMDIQMPVMDGTEAAARLRADPERLGSTPILAMTADVFSSEESRDLFDDLIAKPFDPQKIISQIEAARKAGREKLPGSSDGRTDETLPE